MHHSKHILLFLLIFPYFLNAQSVYEIDWKKEPYVFGITAASLISGFALDQQTEALDLRKILSLDRANVNSFDRTATFKFSAKADGASDVLWLSSYALPAAFLIDPKSRKDFGTIMILYGETIGTAAGITFLAKRIAKRPRPYVYNELVSLTKKQQKEAQFSFFSGHTSLTAANCFFTAKVFSDYFPDSRLRPYVWLGASLVPAVTGFLRVQSGKHYYSDVMAGYAFGAIIGIMIPQLHKIQKDKSLSIYPSSNGAILSWRFN